MRGSLRFRRRVVCALAALAMAAAGCSDDSSPPDRAGGGGVPASTETEPHDDDAPVPPGADDGGDGVERTDDGRLRLGLAGPVAVDPAGASPADVAQVVAVDLLYQGLTVMGDDGEVSPGLAEFSPNEDLDVWTFQLRTDATFADGSAVTADDVVYSLNRVMGTGPGSMAAVGLDNVEAVSATGSATVDIRLRRPSAVLPELLAAPSYGIVQRATMEAMLDGEHRLPNASGDYAVTEIGGDGIVLDRRGDAGPTEIEIVYFATESAALDAFLAGDVDWTVSPADRLDEAIAEAGVDGMVPFHGALYLAIDDRVSPLGRRAVRTAIALAIDRDAIVDEVYGPVAQPLLGVIPAGVPGGSAEDCRAPCGPDRTEAAALLDQALADGQSGPLRILVAKSVSGDGSGGAADSMERVGRVVAEHLQAAGIDAQVAAEEPDTYNQLIASGRQQLAVYSWLGVAQSPAEYLLPLFETGSPDNLTGFSNANVDDGLLLGRTTPGHGERRGVWQQVERAVLQNVAVVPLVQFRTTSVTQERIGGLVVRVDGSLDVSGVTFSP